MDRRCWRPISISVKQCINLKSRYRPKKRKFKARKNKKFAPEVGLEIIGARVTSSKRVFLSEHHETRDRFLHQNSGRKDLLDQGYSFSIGKPNRKREPN